MVIHTNRIMSWGYFNIWFLLEWTQSICYYNYYICSIKVIHLVYRNLNPNLTTIMQQNSVKICFCYFCLNNFFFAGCQFQCDLCKCPYICNPLLKKKVSKLKKQVTASPRHKIDPVTENKITLCNACGKLMRFLSRYFL